MHSCPHCNAPVRYRSIWASTMRRPYACPSCKGQSWLHQPLGLFTFMVLAGMASIYLASFYLAQPAVTVVVITSLALLMGLQLLVTWRFGQLRPIAGTGSPVRA